jgi:hypothetical protein
MGYIKKQRELTSLEYHTPEKSYNLLISVNILYLTQPKAKSTCFEICHW